MHRLNAFVALTCLGMPACAQDQRPEGNSLTSGASTAGDSSTTGFDPVTTTTGTPATSDTTAAETTSTTANFVDMPDGGGLGSECDVWTQDCPDGEKCAPWANDGGNSWNATRCVPLDPNPKQPGDACTTDGSDVSGNDDCELGSLCFAVDPETDVGHCVPMCQGSEANPSCDDPSQTCNVSNNGTLTLCLDACNPIIGDCPDIGQAQGCVPVDDDFLCWPVWQPGAVGEPCEYFNVCAPGTFCATADAVPGCVGASGCCSEFCDTTNAEPDAACSMAAQGAACVPWWEQNAPPGLEGVGGCLIPA